MTGPWGGHSWSLGLGGAGILEQVWGEKGREIAEGLEGQGTGRGWSGRSLLAFVRQEKPGVLPC